MIGKIKYWLIILGFIFSILNLKSQSISDISKFKFYDIKNNEVEFTMKDSNNIYIFYKGISCRSCYIELSKALKIINPNYKIYCIIEESEGIFKRKEIINYVKSIVKFDNYIFIHPNENNILKFYEIKSTPSLLCINNNSASIIKFEDIFVKTIFETSADFKVIERLIYSN